MNFNSPNTAEEIDLLGLNLNDNSHSQQNISNQQQSQSFDISSPKESNLNPSPFSSFQDISQPNVTVIEQQKQEENVKEYEEEDLGFYNKALLSSAQRHKDALEFKRSLEKQSQQSHSNLWSFPVNEKQLEGICGCNAVAYYNYKFTVATFNQTLYESLIDQFFRLHEHNISAVFMSLFEQTVAELLLSRFIHSQVPKVKSMVGSIFSFF